MLTTMDETTDSLQKLNLDSTKKVELKSSDGEIFSVDESIAKQSTMLKNIIEDVTTESSSVIPIPNVTGYVLEIVIDYCQRTDPKKEEELKAFETELKEFDKATVFHLIMAANYLDIKGLLDLTCQTVANFVQDMSVEDVRDYFVIESDLTPEEEQAIRDEYPWAFE